MVCWSVKWAIVISLMSGGGVILVVLGYKIPETKFGNPISRAIASLIVQFYANNTSLVHVVMCFETEESHIYQNGIVNEIIYDTKNEVLYQVEDYKFLTTPNTDSYLIFVDSIKSFKLLFLMQLLREFDRTGFYTIAYTGPKERVKDTVIKNIFRDCWQESVVNVNILLLDPHIEDRVNFFTYFPYSAEGCGIVEPKIYNYFENGAFRHNKETFPKKCANLFNCPIYVGTFHLPPYMILGMRHNKTYYDGIEGIIVRVLSQRLHFDPVLVEPEDDKRHGSYRNKTFTGLLKKIMEEQVNFSLCAMGAFTYEDVPGLAISIPYFDVKVIFVVPPGRPWSNLEKLFFPFKYIIWSCIVTCYLITICLMLVLKFYPKYMADFVFGPQNHSPITSMISVWFNNSLSILPRRNFARYVLTVWMFSTLVLQSSYQGALFDIIRNQKTSSSLNTVAKIYEQQYDVYTTERIMNLVLAMEKRLKPLIKPVELNQLDQLKIKTTEVGFKGVVSTGEPSVSWFNKVNSKKGKILYQSKDVIFNIQTVIYTKKYSCLMEPIDQELWKYLSGGLIYAWSIYFLSGRVFKAPASTASKSLNLSSLTGIFQIYMALMLVAVIVFAFEVCTVRYKWFRSVFKK